MASPEAVRCGLHFGVCTNLQYRTMPSCPMPHPIRPQRRSHPPAAGYPQRHRSRIASSDTFYSGWRSGRKGYLGLISRRIGNKNSPGILSRSSWRNGSEVNLSVGSLCNEEKIFQNILHLHGCIHDFFQHGPRDNENDLRQRPPSPTILIQTIKDKPHIYGPDNSDKTWSNSPTTACSLYLLRTSRQAVRGSLFRVAVRVLGVMASLRGATCIPLRISQMLVSGTRRLDHAWVSESVYQNHEHCVSVRVSR